MVEELCLPEITFQASSWSEIVIAACLIESILLPETSTEHSCAVGGRGPRSGKCDLGVRSSFPRFGRSVVAFVDYNFPMWNGRRGSGQ